MLTMGHGHADESSRPHRRALALGGLLLLVACGGDRATGPGRSCAASTPVTLLVGEYASLDATVSDGCLSFPANTSAESTEYLLVALSASGVPLDSAPFELGAVTPAAAPPAPGGGVRAVPRSAAAAFDGYLRRAEGTRDFGVAARRRLTASPAAAPSAPGTAAGAPPALGSVRSFLVCATPTCATLKTVPARARAVGTHVAIYVDTLAPAGGLDSADLDTLQQTFDTRLYPLDTATFGGVSDLDSNGVVIVLMTGAVNALVSSSSCTTQGFIAGYFFGADLDPTYRAAYNDGEVVYALVPDPGGTLSCPHSAADVKGLLPGTFVHELQHMISYVQHVLVRHGAAEEGWLNEGLSKYAEELAGRSYLPGDSVTFHAFVDKSDLYDAYHYLSAPDSAFLLIPDDDGNLAEVGACWLFVRYLMDQYGGQLAGGLVQTGAVGAANVTAQTGQPFPTLVSRWALANWVSDLPGFSAPPELHYSSWQFRATFQELYATYGPPHFDIPFPLVPVVAAGNAVSVSGWLRAGSGAYSRIVQAPQGAAFTVFASADGAHTIAPAAVPRLAVIRIR